DPCLPDGGRDGTVATIFWGDQTGATYGQIDPSGAVWVAKGGGHTYSEEGTYTIRVNLTNSSPWWGRANTDVYDTAYVADGTLADTLVTSQGKLVNATEGSTLTSVALATFNDPDPSNGGMDHPYNASVTWGDMTTDNIVTVTKSGTSYTVL